MYEPMKVDIWQGRVDDQEADNALRWHQVMRPLDQADRPGIALLGICSDEGVKRNQGRPGARKGPNAIRHALAALPLHTRQPLYDDGNLYPESGDLELLGQQQAERVYQMLDRGHFPILLGGGHEIAYGSFRGLERFVRSRIPGTIGILNFDAHFDLRQDRQATSGTPFLQIAEFCRQAQCPFQYGVLGISESANTPALFQRAAQLDVAYLEDRQLNGWQLQAAFDWLDDFIQPLATLYLTLDLDVLPAAVAPGVSAPAPRGLSLDILEALLEHLLRRAGDRLRLADIAEYNPDLDIDGRSARVAARLCHLLVSHRPREETP